MIIGLDIYRQDGKRIVALRRADGVLTCAESTANMRSDVERWLRHGLIDIEGPEGDKRTRHTSADHPAFLDRLAKYAERHGFVSTLMVDENDASLLTASPPRT